MAALSSIQPTHELRNAIRSLGRVLNEEQLRKLNQVRGHIPSRCEGAFKVKRDGKDLCRSIIVIPTDRSVNQYLMLGKRGWGASSTIRLALNLNTNTPAAVKVIRIGNVKKESSNLYSYYLAEVRSLSSAKGKREIVQLLDQAELVSVRHGIKAYIFLEYCPKGDLNTFVKNELRVNHKIDSGQILTWMRDMTRGLKHLHELQIAHMDIKPHNILLYEEKGEPFLHAKTADLGFADSTGLFPIVLRGTPYYMSKKKCELIGQKNLQKTTSRESQDWWALGQAFFTLIDPRQLTLSEIVCTAKNPEGMFSQIAQFTQDTVDAIIDRECKGDFAKLFIPLLKRLLVVDPDAPSERTIRSADEVLAMLNDTEQRLRKPD